MSPGPGLGSLSSPLPLSLLLTRDRRLPADLPPGRLSYTSQTHPARSHELGTEEREAHGQGQAIEAAQGGQGSQDAVADLGPARALRQRRRDARPQRHAQAGAQCGLHAASVTQCVWIGPASLQTLRAASAIACTLCQLLCRSIPVPAWPAWACWSACVVCMSAVRREMARLSAACVCVPQGAATSRPAVEHTAPHDEAPGPAPSKSKVRCCAPADQLGRGCSDVNGPGLNRMWPRAAVIALHAAHHVCKLWSHGSHQPCCFSCAAQVQRASAKGSKGRVASAPRPPANLQLAIAPMVCGPPPGTLSP